MKGGLHTKRMNKNLIFSVLLGIMLICVPGVFAEDQGINVTIGEDISLIITPTIIEFGPVPPDSTNNPALNGPITFNATGSNVDVNIEVTNVTGFPFESGLLLDTLAPVGQDWDLPCVIVDNLCTYTQEITFPTLNVPVGAPQGVNQGVIIYQITGTPPA